MAQWRKLLWLSLTVWLPAAHADGHMLNVRDVEIRTLAEAVSEATGRNFIIDPRVKGQVTVISSRPMDKDALYETFLSVLQVHDFAAVPAGNAVKIVPSITARQLGEQYDTQVSADALVTQVLSLGHVSAAQLAALLRPLLPQEAHLVAYEPGNLLIVSDHAANVGRITSIVKRMDIASDDSIEITPLTHARAEEVVQMLSALPGAGGTDPKSRMLIADARTNSILISGDKAEKLRLRSLITHLDTPLPHTPTGSSQSQWIRLKHAKATQVAGLLKEYLAADEKDSEGKEIKNRMTLLPDESANALLVRGPEELQQEVRLLIAEMDAPRAQVLVEAIIAEVGADTSKTLGISLAGRLNGALLFSDFPNTLGVGLGQVLSALLGGGGEDDSGGSVPEGFTAGGAVYSNGELKFLGLLRALGADSNTRILSTPSLVTLDHQEAEISVGQEVPFITGSFTSTGDGGGSVNPFQTLERRDVGLTLRLTPHILDDQQVELTIYQEVSSLSPATQAADVITNKRTLTTAVVVESDQIIGLGGLIDERNTDRTQKIPGLGDLPLIGHAFRATSTQRTRQNLMIFIRTRILPNLSPLKAYSQQRWDELGKMNALPGLAQQAASTAPEGSVGTPPSALPAPPETAKPVRSDKKAPMLKPGPRGR